MTDNQVQARPGSRELLALPDAEIELLPAFLSDAESLALLADLQHTTPWREESIRLFGKQYLQPRLFAWYGDVGAVYQYSGVTLTPLPWSDTLMALKLSVERCAGAEFNSVLLNYYRHERDSMGMHADDEAELGQSPSIASLSVGACRPFTLRHRYRKDLKPVHIALASGSLLLMRGQTQRFWKHGLRKLNSPCDARINLTFRKIIDAT